MKQAGSTKGLKQAVQQADQSGYYDVKVLYEGNFIKNAAAKAKEFLKRGTANIKKAGKEFIKTLRNTSSSKTTEMMRPGTLVSFQYDAKFKDKTTWDKAPLAIILGPSSTTKGNFYGLNIHHLPLNDRVNIASFFIELKKKRKGKLQYQDIKPFITKFSGHPVLRQYIFKRVKPKIYIIEDDMFLTSAGLPSEDMVKAIK